MSNIKKFTIFCSFIFGGMLKGDAWTDAGIYLPNNNPDFSRSQTPLLASDMDGVTVNRGGNLWQQCQAYTDLLKAELTRKERAEFGRAFASLCVHPSRLKAFLTQFDSPATEEMLLQHYPIFAKKVSTGQTFWQRFKEVNLENAAWDYGMVGLLQETQANGYPVGIATNQPSAIFNFLQTTPSSPLKGLPLNLIFTGDTVISPSDRHMPVKKPAALYFKTLRQQAQAAEGIIGDPKKERLQDFVPITYTIPQA